jgi:hypothetical protein
VNKINKEHPYNGCICKYVTSERGEENSAVFYEIADIIPAVHDL